VAQVRSQRKATTCSCSCDAGSHFEWQKQASSYSQLLAAIHHIHNGMHHLFATQAMEELVVEYGMLIYNIQTELVYTTW